MQRHIRSHGLRYDAGRFRVLVALGALVLAPLLVAPAARASCGSPANAIEAENCQPGTPASTWDIAGAGSESLQGYATDISVDQGQTVHFKVDTDASDYRLDIYRWAGTAATVRAGWPRSSRRLAAAPEPAGLFEDGATGLIDCGDWAESASWSVPADAASGIYFAHLVREDGTSARATSPSSSAMTTAARTCSFRPPTRPGRPTTSTAATACTSATRALPRARLQGVLQPAVHDTRDLGRGLAVQRRISDGPVPRAQRLRRQLLHGRRHGSSRRPSCSSTARSCRSATTSTGRVTSARTSRPPATRA